MSTKSLRLKIPKYELEHGFHGAFATGRGLADDFIELARNTFFLNLGEAFGRLQRAVFDPSSHQGCFGGNMVIQDKFQVTRYFKALVLGDGAYKLFLAASVRVRA